MRSHYNDLTEAEFDAERAILDNLKAQIIECTKSDGWTDEAVAQALGLSLAGWSNAQGQWWDLERCYRIARRLGLNFTITGRST
jgi:hypothetical protein